MDNATYDVLKRSPINSNETYSMLSMISTNVNQNFETQRKDYTNRHEVKSNDSKGAPSKQNKSLLMAAVIMMVTVVLLLISIASLALSVAAYNQLKPEQSTIQNQQSNTDNDLTEAQTKLDTTCGNVSEILLQLDTKINNLTSLLLRNTDMEPQSNCGPGLWYRVAHLNMTDPSQQCPCVWREYSVSGSRVCGRPDNSDEGCITNRYLINNQYSRVCGRVIGYRFNTPDGFRSSGADFDGINITNGAQHTHVWSYVSDHRNSNCPCSFNGGSSPPSISNRYYCESGETNNPLWDGLQCGSSCCAGPGTNSSPPWFSVQLPAPSTEIIEVSICCDQDTNDEDIPIRLLEIYVQ